MASTSPPLSGPGKRIDLHCHSRASNRPAEAVLSAIHCPESYSEPLEVYEQGRRRGMDFITLTDHDTIEGALELAGRADVLVGEELTCFFPEDGCKLHLLVWGLTGEDHQALQQLASDLYQVAEYIERRQLAHAVAHPLYRQNDKLERWHIERLLLLFKGFECLNGAHSALHRQTFEPMLDRLDEGEIGRLAEKHALVPRWPEPWRKSRTGGSDDHGLLNIGRTWTEFPAEVKSTEQLLDCLRTGRCAPGGEAGSSTKLAHTFYSVAVRYYTRHILPAGSRPNVATMLLQGIVGERPHLRKRDLARAALRGKIGRALRPFSWRRRADRSSAESGTAGLLRSMFIASAQQRAPEHPSLGEALRNGLPPLGEHAEMFGLASAIHRDLSGGVAEAIDAAIDDGRFNGLFDAISAALAQQFVLLPYYFACFHQNREKQLLRRLGGQAHAARAQTIKVGLFTDTFEDVNGVARFLQNMSRQARRQGRQLTIHTCSPRSAGGDDANHHRFQPLFSTPMPLYPELALSIPPVAEVLEFADRQQYDAIHVSTPGPMGLCGLLVAKMLRVPLLGTHHTDFPAYVAKLTGDHRMAGGATAYLRWLYGAMQTIFSRSSAYHRPLHDLGVYNDRLATTLPGIDTGTFHPRHRDAGLFERLNIPQPRRLLYVGRISAEKNLPLLAEAFLRLCRTRRDTALIVAGDGPYLPALRSRLKEVPAYFLGYQSDAQLGPLYASADLFIFPSHTDTLGQVVLEAQASGLPALVSDEGGPREMIDDGVTGLVLAGDDPALWSQAIDDLLADEPRRQRMGRVAPQRIERYSLEQTFDAWWSEHLAAIRAVPDPEQADALRTAAARWSVA
jgi:glycosyltransferase involved in cell wall biosynthesis